MSPEIREQVLAAARKMGYRVDPIISAGMSQMRKHPEKRIESVLAWMDATPMRDSVSGNPALHLAFEGALAQAADLGYRLERFWLYEPKVSPTRLNRILRARGIEAVVVLQYYRQTKYQSPPPMDFDFSGLACVSITTRLSGMEIPFVQADHFACAELALNHMRDLGYRRIGLVSSPSVDLLTQYRVHSAYEGFVARHADLTHIPVFSNESQDEQVALRLWLEETRPDGVLGWKPPDEFRNLGFDVPGHLGVCMLDRIPGVKDIAGVDQNHLAIGAAAVRLVHAQLQQGIRGVPHDTVSTMVHGRWIPGSSLRPMDQTAVKQRTSKPD
jgi:DNA-binding LacI/PurR family transcriptional regulator